MDADSPNAAITDVGADRLPCDLAVAASDLRSGVESTDVLLLIMGEKGMEHLASDKFTVGGDASAAAGPVGRTVAADTDASLHAEILTYSRSKGAFAGISLEGTVVTQDGGENSKIYGHDANNHDILHGTVKDTTPPIRWPRCFPTTLPATKCKFSA